MRIGIFNMRFNVDDTLLLVIDIQEKLVPVMKEKELLINNTRILIKGLEILQVPNIVTQQYTKGLGMTIKEISDVIDNFNYFEKLTFSSYSEKCIRNAVKDYGKKCIIVCGIEAHICVLQTVLDLLEDGYQVIVVEDCISSRKEHDKVVALNRMRDTGAIITTYESILFELTYVAGTTTFKSISKLIK